MGLDVYVGTFERYYTGQWETIIQKLGREAGMQVQVVRANQSGWLERVLGWFRPKPNVSADIEAWRSRLSKEAGVPLAWNESQDAEYFTDKPGWDCYGAVLLWAAYEEAGSGNRPITAESWSDDEVLRGAMENRSSKYRHLLNGTEIWLPGEIEPFSTESLARERVMIGSTTKLGGELAALNRATWNASPSEISAWRKAAPEPDAPLEESAKFGFALLSELVDLAIQHRLPMKLDY